MYNGLESNTVVCVTWSPTCVQSDLFYAPGIARRCNFCDKTLSLCQNRQGNVFSCLLEFVLGLIIMYWDYIIQKWSPSWASCHLFLVSLVPKQLRSWCSAVPCADQAAGLWGNRYLSSWVSPAWHSAKLSVSWWRKRLRVCILMPNSVFQQAVSVSCTENVELLLKRSRSQGCQLLVVLKRVSFSCSWGVLLTWKT